jgi:2,3-dihydro-2,3-dihydroxybenzoate dehydrogenase
MVGFDFTGKTVWVTGAGKGIGYATALAFVEAGAQVTGFDLAFPQGDYPFATETLNLADAAQVSEVCGRLLSSLERLDVLVNAAGILRMGATDELSQDDWQQTFAVNVGGAFNLFQQTMGQFRRQQGGAIVTVASDAAHTPRIGMSAYGASKAALKSLALQMLSMLDKSKQLVIRSLYARHHSGRKSAFSFTFQRPAGIRS